MPGNPTTNSIRSLWLGFLLAAILPLAPLFAETLNLEESLEKFRTGKYAQCVEDSRSAVEQYRWSKNWRVLYIQSLLTVGQYQEALTAVEQILERFPLSMRLSQLGHSVFLANGQNDKAEKILHRIHRYAQSTNISYWDADDIVALGEVLLLLGGEPRTVLESFFNHTLEKDPDCRAAYLAAGNLALNKYDYELAGDLFQNALKRFQEEPDMHYGLARAFYSSDRKVMIQALDAVFLINPNHVPSLLLLAEHQIDSEDYPAVRKTLQRILEVNPWRPEAWAYRSLLAHLDNDPTTAQDFRAKALKFNPKTPQVDYL